MLLFLSHFDAVFPTINRDEPNKAGERPLCLRQKDQVDLFEAEHGEGSWGFSLKVEARGQRPLTPPFHFPYAKQVRTHFWDLVRPKSMSVPVVLPL